jgi:hypothetical protein
LVLRRTSRFGQRRAGAARAIVRIKSATAAQASPAIGGVASLRGIASVTGGSTASTLKAGDAIFRGDVLQTAADGTLGITFDDATTFSLLPNSQIKVDDFVYQEHGKHNAAAFEVIQGTAAFVASAVAKTGDMKIDTPTATIGIRGTAGIIEIRRLPRPAAQAK